jgi:hypothetical protein
MPSEASEIKFFKIKALRGLPCMALLTCVQESPILFDCVKLYLMNQVVVALGSFHYLTGLSFGGF